MNYYFQWKNRNIREIFLANVSQKSGKRALDFPRRYFDYIIIIEVEKQARF